MEPSVNAEQQLINIVQQLLLESGVESHRKIDLHSSIQRHLGIDSFGRAELLQRIEKEFAVELPDTLIAEADTLQDILNGIYTASPRHKKDPQQIQSPQLEKPFINPAQAKTLTDVLLLYATGDADRPHIYMQNDDGSEEIITYGKLFENSLKVAAALIKRGIKPGETVAIMQPTNPGFFYTFFGILLANAVPVPIYPPLRPNQIESYAKLEAKILQNAEARILVTFHEAEQLSKLLRTFVPSLKEVTTVNELLKNDEKAPYYGNKASDFGLIQYTSGSTSAPKGVLLTHQNLLTNIRVYGEAIKVTNQDVAVSWAPLYHDLGLIGMWLGSLYHGIPLVLMSPLAFLNRPERWLWAIHYHKGTISGGPNFAYELCVRKIEPGMIEGLDLSSWRLAVNGAEAIQPKTLARFTEKFAPYGFKPETHFPVYGLAESTVCLATSPLNRAPRIDRIDRKAFEEKAEAVATTDTNEQNSLEFVACGIPLPNHEVQIVNEDGEALADRHIGRLYFKGPSSMQGYYRNPEATLAVYHNGWWDSGDLAYIADKEIFITGRRKDVIIKAGRNLYPAEIEELTSQVAEIRKGCVIAFSVKDSKHGTEKLIIAAETRDKKPKQKADIIEKVQEKIITALDVAPDQIILLPPHSIPKTSSGKLQRAACKASYLSGTLQKQHTPLWFQLAKIGFNAAWIKLKEFFSNTFKLIYTLYAVIIFIITLIPVYLCLWIFPRDIAATICKYWARIFSLFAFCPIKIDSKYTHQDKPVIFAANHASYIDVLVLLSLLPSKTRFIGKQELLNHFLTRHFIKKLDYILVDRTDSAKGVEDTKEIEKALKAGFPVAIFPEGTFSYSAGLRPFRLGAFKIAADTNSPICPIAINGTRTILRGENLLFRPGKIEVTFNELIYPEGNSWQDITNFKNKVRIQIAKGCGEPTLDLITSQVAEE